MSTLKHPKIAGILFELRQLKQLLILEKVSSFTSKSEEEDFPSEQKLVFYSFQDLKCI